MLVDDGRLKTALTSSYVQRIHFSHTGLLARFKMASAMRFRIFPCAFQVGILLSALFVGMAAFPAPVLAEFRMCNKTHATIGVAVGYQQEKQWTTEGWWNLPANSCEVLVEGPLESRYYYVYALDYQNGGEWSGDAIMCTRERAFTITGIVDCVARGFERTGFYEVDTGDKQSWTVQLKEPDESGIGGQ
ncbi:MAG: DUF1036 domain-containing protein [Pseudomonadota bacterium]